MRPIRVGVTEKNRNPYWDMVNAGWLDAAERLDLEIEIAAPESEDVEAQVGFMREQLESGVDALAFVATRTDAFDEVIREAAARDVPVIAFDLDAPDSGRLLFVGMEKPVDAGRRAGQQMAARLHPGATVIVQTGSDKAPGARGKRQGFLEVMAERGIAVIEAPTDHEDAALAFAHAESLLRANPQVDGLFGVYGYHPIAQARAVDAVGSSAVIVGFDMLPETVELLEQGAVAASTWIQEYYFGYFSAAAVSDIVRLGRREALLLRGMDPDALGGNTFIPEPTTFTPETIGEFKTWSANTALAHRTSATTF